MKFFRKRSMLNIVLYLGVAFLAVGLLLRLFESSLLYHPASLSSGLLAIYVRDLGIETGEWEEVEITTEDDETLVGWYGRPAAPRAHLLWFHGNAGNVSHRWDDFRRFVEKENLAVLIVDYRGYGRSTGSPSEEGLYLDAHAAWDWLVKRGIPPEQIVVLGRSLGGSVATELATARPVPALILESTFLSIKEMSKQTFPWYPAHWFAKSDYPTETNLPKLDIPILLFHGKRDRIVPFAHGERLATIAKEGRLTFVPVPGAGHNDLSPELAEDYFRQVNTFIDASVRGSPDRNPDSRRSE